MPRAWDLGLDYDMAYRRLLAHIRGGRGNPCYDAILLIQLRNGSRVSEAVRAFKEFVRRRSVEAVVRVSKRRDGATRLMVLPRELDPKTGLTHSCAARPEQKI